MDLVGKLPLLLCLFLVVSAVLVWLYGRFGRWPSGSEEHSLPPVEGETAIDRAIAPLLAGQADDAAGLSLVHANREALALRITAVRAAGRSLDLQYYYWKDDLTGGLLMREVIAAADRGVRVRLLLDDINAGLHDRSCIALDAHANISVRLFNPSRARTDRFRRGLEMAMRAFRATRRMHNKAFIADGRIAIMGGRNIGDAYFDADEDTNFRDLDIWMIGKAVADAGGMFDRYWNSPVVLPIGSLRTPRPKYLGRLRADLAELADRPAARLLLSDIEASGEDASPPLTPEAALHWCADVEVLADPPEKALMARRSNWIFRDLMPAMMAAKDRLRIVSPYFVPGVDGTSALTDLTDKGVRVEVLTNSLAATDVAAVHGGYARYRRRLLRGGVALFELKADHVPGDPRRIKIFGSRTASLHSKAFTVDGERGFVGSVNFDPRSVSLNTETGVLFSHRALVAEVDGIIDIEMAPDSAFALSLHRGLIRWRDAGEGGRPRTLYREPEAGRIRRLTAAVIRFLPVESQL
ncbi:phospholipase D family protein [Rhizobium sp. RU20A]|uniref:phospholipase D family protein n=1 Tax=Rhizobium sp. RU20A TaxID=1907412 RepID=UPI00122CEE72|nr:phospholipase D family protein [Rhizobium sp. RU20A]